MTFPICLDLLTHIPLLGAERLASLSGLSSDEILEDVIEVLPPDAQVLLRQECEEMPYLLPTVCFNAKVAVEHGLEFAAVSEFPTSTMEFARHRRTELIQRIEPGRLTLAIVHSPRRHPLHVPTEVAAAADS